MIYSILMQLLHCIFFVLKAGVVTRGKNLKDRRCWFIVGWLMFLQFYFEF